MTSKILAISEKIARKSGLRMKIDGRTRIYTMSIQTVVSNSTIFCSLRACQKTKRIRPFPRIIHTKGLLRSSDHVLHTCYVSAHKVGEGGEANFLNFAPIFVAVMGGSKL